MLQLRAEEMEQILNGTFTLDCIRMTLSPSQAGIDRRSYAGSGSIAQTPRGKFGKFKVKIYCDESISPVEAFAPLSLQPGTLIGESEYYSLAATDLLGREWGADRILPNLHVGQDFTGFIVEGDSSEIWTVSRNSYQPKAERITIFYRGAITIPCNEFERTETYVGDQKATSTGTLNLARFRAAGFEVKIRKEEKAITVQAASEWQPITDSTWMRIAEGLQIALGRSLRWSVIETEVKDGVFTRVSAAPSNEQKTRIGPPIHYQEFDRDGSVWILFERYLRYALLFRKELSHPIFGLFHSIIESGSVSIEAETLASSVGIEALLKWAFDYIGQPDEAFRAELEAVKKGIRCMPITQATKQKVIGSLNNMLSPRAQDKLNIMTKAGLIEPRLVKAWRILRNKAAHGTIIALSEFEEYVRLCDSNLVLFYQLLFLAIGYSGPYADYSSIGYPQKRFKSGVLPGRLFLIAKEGLQITIPPAT